MNKYLILCLGVFFNFLTFSTVLSRGQAQHLIHPSDIGFCEEFTEKSVNSSLFLDRGDSLTYPLSEKRLLKGQAYAGYRVFKDDEFKSGFRLLPFLAGDKIFASEMVSLLLGVFVTENKQDEFYTPEFHLDKKFIERIGRKLYVQSHPQDYSVKALKRIKHSLPLLPQTHIDLKIKVAGYDYQSQTWQGHPQAQVPIHEVELLNKGMRSQISDLIPIYTISSFTTGENGMLKGSRFFTSAFYMPHHDKTLVVTLQFISLELNWLVKRALHMLPGILKKTLFRDYSRFVDAVRLFQNFPA